MVNKVNVQKIIDKLTADSGKHIYMNNFVRYCELTPFVLEQLNQDIDQIAVAEVSLGYTPVTHYEPCNTAFCICGWANFIHLEENGIIFNKETNVKSLALGDEDRAAAWLGMHVAPAHSLFYMTDQYGLDHVRRSTFDKMPEEDRRAIAIRVLEILRDEEKVDWGRATKEVLG